jgi:ubiquinone/menaquinone biosynthesis C-methylase UbiE
LSSGNSFFSSAGEAVARGFSKQSFAYDQSDKLNPVLQDLRQQVHDHLQRYLKPQSKILELNAGTGIDAAQLATEGHRVHATDISGGMIDQIGIKIDAGNLRGLLTCQQLSFDELHLVSEKKFDYVFSNMGGLNCTPDLSRVTQHLPSLLKPGAYVTWVIMPPVCPWELLQLLKGNWRQALRRWNKNGVVAHVEGEYFNTYYHSLKEIRRAFGPAFELIQAEGLAALSPPPHRGDIPMKNPGVYRVLRKADWVTRKVFPFNRWADHIIVTMQYKPRT